MKKLYKVTNRAEDGTYVRSFASFEKANAYLEDLAGTTLAKHDEYIGLNPLAMEVYKQQVEQGRGLFIVDDWGRQISLHKETKNATR